MANIKPNKIIQHGLVAIIFLTFWGNNYVLAQNNQFHISEAGVITLTSGNFDSLVNLKGVALVDFWATWCGPCLMQAPVIEDVKKEIGNKVLVGKIDVDKNTSISKRYSIRGIPALLIFKDGVVVEKMVGYQQKQKLIASLKKYIAE